MAGGIGKIFQLGNERVAIRIRGGERNIHAAGAIGFLGGGIKDGGRQMIGCNKSFRWKLIYGRNYHRQKMRKLYCLPGNNPLAVVVRRGIIINVARLASIIRYRLLSRASLFVENAVFLEIAFLGLCAENLIANNCRRDYLK